MAKHCSAVGSGAWPFARWGLAPALADDPILTKAAPTFYAPPLRAACGSVYDFFFTACPLTWYGVTFYGTVDTGVSYMTHGSPFDRNYPQAV